MPLSPVRIAAPPTRREAVIDTLRDAIVTGTLEPGAFLRETALAAMLGVSATPVREAMGRLQAEGLVEIEAHRHKRVTPIDPAATRDLLEVQSHLWRLGYERGIPMLDDARLRHLHAAVGDYRRALEEGPAHHPASLLAAIRASHAFHTAIISAAGSGELLRVTLDRLALVARFIVLRGSATIGPAGLKLHEGILAAIESGERAQAMTRFDALNARMIALTDPPRAVPQAEGA